MNPLLGQFPYMGLISLSIVTCLLKARIVKPAERAIAREWFCKNVFIVTKYACNNKRAVGGGFFSVGSVPELYNEGQLPLRASHLSGGGFDTCTIALRVVKGNK
jgi:hypothetical protein